MTHLRTWWAVEIVVDPKATEAIEFALNELDTLGTETGIFGAKRSETVGITGYFDEKPEEGLLESQISGALRIYGFADAVLRKITWSEVRNKDWLAEWKKYWNPTIVGRFVIAPPWDESDFQDRIVIRIEPNMAFGTGTHETTRLCLSAIDELYSPGDSFLDVGTGTGILAIAAASKLSAIEFTENTEPVLDHSARPISVVSLANISACDTDPDSVKIARENAELNDVLEAIEFFEGSITDDTPTFDFVCANLTIDAILPILPTLLAKARKTLVLSGILTEQETLILDGLKRSGAASFEIERQGEWISIIVTQQRD